MADEQQTLAAPVSLTPTNHAGLRIKESGSAMHIARNHFAKIYTPEFSRAGLDYPIIFVKDPETDAFFAAGMWGIEPNENLFVKDDKWTGGYFPASVRCFPFAVQPDPENRERLFIGIYETAEIVNKEEGNLIFNEDGTESDWMKEVKEFLVRVFQQEEMTKDFVAKLNELELLVPQALNLTTAKDGKKHDVSGFFVVDKEKLANLPDETLLELRKSGALEIIYYHLMSLNAIEKVLRNKNDRAEPAAPANDEAPAS